MPSRMSIRIPEPDLLTILLAMKPEIRPSTIQARNDIGVVLPRRAAKLDRMRLMPRRAGGSGGWWFADLGTGRRLRRWMAKATDRPGDTPMAEPTKQDAIALLKADHRKVEGLFADFEKATQA